MNAILILVVAAFMAWLYAKLLDRLNGEEMMTLGPLVLVPWLVIVVGALVALVAWS